MREIFLNLNSTCKQNKDKNKNKYKGIKQRKEWGVGNSPFQRAILIQKRSNLTNLTTKLVTKLAVIGSAFNKLISLRIGHALLGTALAVTYKKSPYQKGWEGRCFLSRSNQKGMEVTPIPVKCQRS